MNCGNEWTAASTSAWLQKEEKGSVLEVKSRVNERRNNGILITSKGQNVRALYSPVWDRFRRKRL